MGAQNHVHSTQKKGRKNPRATKVNWLNEKSTEGEAKKKTPMFKN